MSITRRAMLGGIGFGALTTLGLSRAWALSRDDRPLKPGDFVWEPQLSPDGPMVFIVSLPEQMIHVYRNGIEIGISTCSTGMPGHTTPTGVFTILQKDKDHHSSVYNEASMPYSERLTWDGVALHAGGLPGYPSSHGCVHLPLAFSQAIFAVTTIGIPVIICDSAAQPETVVHPGIILPPEAEQEAAAAMMKAANTPARPPDATTRYYDVMSGVVSGADKTASLLIDGQVAWQSPVEIADPRRPLGNQAYTLLGPTPDGKAISWLAHGIQGDQTVVGRADSILSRIKVVKAAEAASILARGNKGSTLVVTDLPAGPDTRTTTDFVILS